MPLGPAWPPLLMAILVVILLGVVSLTLRAWGAWTWAGPALIVMGLWTLPRLLLRSPAQQMAYDLLALAISMAILSTFFASSDRPAPRAFALLLAAALACGAYANLSGVLERAGGSGLLFEQAGRQAGSLLALACGALAPSMLPGAVDRKDRRAFPQAVLAATLAGLFLVLYGRPQAPAPGGSRWSLGWSWDLPFPDELVSFLYAGVLFLFLFSLFRALGDPRWRLRGYGLAFLFLAGAWHHIPYQHLLGLIALVLLARGSLGPAEPDPPTVSHAAG